MELRTHRMHSGFAERSSKMYILPMLTHLEVVALGGRSDIFFSNILIVNRTGEHGESRTD